MKGKIVFILAFFCLLLSGCVLKTTDVIKEDFVDVNKLRIQAIGSLKEHTPVEIQENINSLAPVVAKAIAKDTSFKDLLGFEVGKKFDGDYDALYDIISTKVTKSGKIVHQILKEYGNLFDEKVKTIPYFNISIPAGFDKWGTYDGPIYVIPMRYDIDDREIKALPGYDGEGNVKMFPADKAPDYPVVVIGINERVDLMAQEKAQENALFKPAVIQSSKLQKGSNIVSPMASADGSILHAETIRGLKVIKSYDAWYNSDNEIYILYAVGEDNYSLKQPCSDATEANKQYVYDSIIFYYENTPNNMFWKMVIREADFDWGKYIKFPVSGGFTWESETFKISATFDTNQLITNEDDTVGETQIYFYHPLGVYGWSEILCGDAYIRLGYGVMPKPE